MKIAICDDNPEDQKILKKYLCHYGLKMEVELELFFCESGENLLRTMKRMSFDIIFMDIYMKGMGGMEAAREIRRFDKQAQIIFVTISPDHAISSYDVKALYYILKPVSYSKIEKVLNLCQFEDRKAEKQIAIQTGKTTMPINTAKILYAEMFNKVLTIHTICGAIESRTSMEKFEIQLGGNPFLRCHRSFLVNMDFIEDIGEDIFLLTNKEEVPISRPVKAFALKTYNEYIFSGMRKKLC
ncbi:MAG: LytTR family DNA-binding domain-containing protein [Acetivibrio sp.]